MGSGRNLRVGSMVVPPGNGGEVPGDIQTSFSPYLRGGCHDNQLPNLNLCRTVPPLSE